MALLTFQRPDKITLQKATDFEVLLNLNRLSPDSVLPLVTHCAVFC